MFKVKSQVSVPSNAGSPSNYVGWNAAQSFPLEVQHQGNQPINISTNGFRRIHIDNGGGTNVDGRVLITDDGLGTTPTARLHLHQKNNGFTNIRFTSSTTGATSTNGFEIGMVATGDASFITNESNANFNWYNQGGGPGNLRNRMRLYGDGLGQNTGRLVLSDNLPASFTPGARLHIFQATGGTQNGKLFRTDGDSTGTSEWELYTGTTSANLVRKFRIMTSIPTGYNNNGGDIYQEAFQGDIIFRVNGKRTGGTGSNSMPPNAGYATNGAKEVMRITHVYNNYLQRNEGRVSISMDTTSTVGTTIRNPRSMLQIGEVSSGGWRNWMNVGTYYDYGTDCMYTGIKALSPLSLDQNESIIAWGNNPSAANQPDRLRFVFTAAGIAANGTSGTLDGLEAMRVVADTGTTKMGIGNFYFINVNPANMLEIKSDAKCPYWITNNSSGLRLRNLTSAAPIVANGTNGVNNQKMLTVDVNGDVVLTTVPTVGPSTSPGNYCSTTSNPLTSDYQIPLNTKKYLFSGQSTINNSVQQDVVAVGYNCSVNLPISKFSVLENQTSQTTTETYAGYFQNNNSTSSQNFQDITGGIISRSFRNQGTLRSTNIGGVFEAHNCTKSIGVIGRLGRSSMYSRTNIGVGGMFIADTIPLPNGGTNYDNYGVYAKASSGVNNFAIYAETVGSSNLNPFTPAGNFAGYFVGDVVRTGNDNFTSDQKLKENIEDLLDGLSILNKIETKIYEYKTAEYEQMNLPNGKQYGVIAQQVQTVLPELINQVVHPAKYDGQGNILKEKVDYLTVEYQQFIPLLIRSMQQLSQQNNHLDSVVKALTKTINMNNVSTGFNQNTNIELTDKNAVILNQNVPNPFAESTTISYEISVDFTVAQIIFNTNNGRIIKVVDIKEKGKGTLNVFANDLSSGIYNYYLIVDGKIIDTKKMIKQD